MLLICLYVTIDVVLLLVFVRRILDQPKGLPLKAPLIILSDTFFVESESKSINTGSQKDSRPPKFGFKRLLKKSYFPHYRGPLIEPISNLSQN